MENRSVIKCILTSSLVFLFIGNTFSSVQANVQADAAERTNDREKVVQNHFLSSSFSTSLSFSGPLNPYADDLIVESDDRLEDDIVVYSGDVTIEEGGKIIGSLTVMSGDIEIEAGGRVEGDVTNFSGDVIVAGKILGDLAVMSGDVDLVRSGSVSGDVSVWSGEVEESADSHIGGDVMMGLTLDELPSFGSFWSGSGEIIPEDVKKSIADDLAKLDRVDRSSMGRFFSGLFRLLGVGAISLVVAAIAGGLTMWRPNHVESVRRRLRSETVINFAVGLLFNVVVGFLTVLFTATCILIPMALLTVGLLIGINGVGWTALSASVGRKLTGYTNATVTSTATVILGGIDLDIAFCGCLGNRWRLSWIS